MRDSFAPSATLMAFYDARHGIKSKPQDFMPGRERAGDGMECYRNLMGVAGGEG